MKLFKDVELLYSDIFSQRPNRVLNINTTAPIQTQPHISPDSAGVSTFKDSESYSDRFIVWRATGQKLFLEERSISHTILDNALCIDFGRTTITPGTFMAIEKFIFCLVVPTQSGVHRFIARLSPKPTDEAPSIFSQINDKEFIGENHFSIILTTPGDPKKACVLSDVFTTKVLYCMNDGKTVLMSLPSKRQDPGDESILQDRGFLSRFITSTNAHFAIDVDGIMTPSGIPVFYVLYKDGSIRLWTIGKEISSITVCPSKFAPHLKLDQGNLFMRVDVVKQRLLVTIANELDTGCEFHCFTVDDGMEMSYLTSTTTDYKEELVDFRILYNNEPGIKLVAVWDPKTNPSSYILAYTYLQSDNSSLSELGWTVAENALQETRDYPKMSAEQLKESIFDADRRSFDIVNRAAVITCEGSTVEVAHNDWRALQSHVEQYIRFPDPTKYKERMRSKRLSTIESGQSFERKFLLELVSNCDQLDESERGAIALFTMDLPKANLVGVIQKEYFTLVHYTEITVDKGLDTTIHSFLDNLPKSGEETPEGLAEYERSVRKIGSMLGEGLGDKFCGLIKRVLEVADITPREPAHYPSACSFRGQFTAGLIAAKVRENAKNYHEFADGLLRIRNFANKMDIFSFEGSNLELIYKLDSFRTGLEFILKIFDLKMQMKFTGFTLGSWLFSAGDLSALWCEGSMSSQQYQNDILNFNLFVNSLTTASLRAVWPTNSGLIVCRTLTEHFKWNTLHKVCLEYAKRRLHGAGINYYLAIAFSGSNHAEKALSAFSECFLGNTQEEPALQRAMRPPGSQLIPTVSLGEVYAQAIKFVHEQEQFDEVIKLCRGAIEALPEGDPHKTRVYATLFNLLVNRGVWGEALDTIKRNKDQETKKATLIEFVNRMLRAKQGKALISLHFGELEQQVESILLSTARAQEIEADPHLFELIFSYYMKKYRYPKAAQIMLEYSFYLKQATQTKDLLRKRRDILAAASTVFEMLPKEDRFTFFPQEQTLENEEEEAPERMEDDESVTNSQPATKISTLIVDEKTVQTEWAIAKARLAILENDIQPPLNANDILKLLIENKNYDEAFDICREFNIDSSALFTALAINTVMLDVATNEETPTWVLQNRRHVGKSLSNNWSVVQGILRSARQAWPCDSRPFRAVVSAILSHSVDVPQWLQVEYTDFDLPDYVRCLVNYDRISTAVVVLAELLERETEKLVDYDVNIVLPYAVINDVFNVASTMKEGTEIIAPLKKAFEIYVARLTALESAHRLES